MSHIEFAPPDSTLLARCPVCRSDGQKETVLRGGAPNSLPHDLVLCPDCGARFYVPPPAPDYTTAAEFNDYVRHYVEIGAGIGTIYEMLFRCIDTRFSGSMLDVGCGYGFSIDLINTLTNGTAVGVEPSEYGAAGARELGLTIYRSYLEDCDELRAASFDLVFASEVIEHVHQPLAFLTQLANRLAPGGKLVLTTPNAEVVRPDTPASSLLPVLSLGFHTVLFTASAMQGALEAVGLPHAHVVADGTTLHVYAAREPFELLEKDRPHPETLVLYYERKLAGPTLPQSVRFGLSYRLFRDLVNRGEFVRAAPLADAVPIPAEFASRDGGSLDEVGRMMPFCAPCHSHYRAMFEFLHVGDIARSAQMFGKATELLEFVIRAMPQFTPEEALLLGRTKYFAAFTSLLTGDKARAAEICESVRADGLALDESLSEHFRELEAQL